MHHFINGAGDAKAVRDVEIRMYYARETIRRNIFKSLFVPSGDNNADYMTKPATGQQPTFHDIYINMKIPSNICSKTIYHIQLLVHNSNITLLRNYICLTLYFRFFSLSFFI